MTDQPDQWVLEELFGSQAPLALEYAAWLKTTGVTAGLIGPREADRLWERHILNSAALAELIPQGVAVADVGSGAGLPGVPLALARPDIQITLVEPLARRVEPVQKFLLEHRLGVSVLKARAESAEAKEKLSPIPVVVSRAVASLDTLGKWTSLLLPVGGKLLAIKGRSASEELERTRKTLMKWGFDKGEVSLCKRVFSPSDPKVEATVVVLQKVSEPRDY